MSFVPLLILLNLFKIIFPFEKEYISFLIDNKYKLKNDTNDTNPNILPCFDYVIADEKDYSDFFRCMFNCCKYDISGTKENISMLLDSIPSIIIDNMDNETKLIIKILEDSRKNGLYNETFDLLEKYPIIIKTAFKVIDEYEKGNNSNLIYIWTILPDVFIIDDFHDYLMRFYNYSRNDFVDLLTLISKNFPDVSNMFELIKENIEEKDEIIIIEFAYNITKYYNNDTEFFGAIENFLKNNKNLYPNIEKILSNEAMEFFYKKVLSEDNLMASLEKVIFNKQVYIKMFLDIFKNDTFIEKGIDLISHIRDDNYLKEHLAGFISAIVRDNSTYLDTATNILYDLAVTIYKNQSLTTGSWSIIQKGVIDFFKWDNVTSSLYDLSMDCMKLFNYTFFDYVNSEKSLFHEYFQKFLFDSSRNKGDFLTFDNCLNAINDTLSFDEYIIYPAFIIGIINEPPIAKISKNSSFYLKYNYIRNFCFPFGFINKTEQDKNNPMCSEKDYNGIIKFVLNLFNNVDNVTVHSFYLYQDNKSPSAIEYIYGVFGILLLAIPLIIYIILYICKKIITKKSKRNDLINELVDDNEKRKKLNTSKNEIIKDNKIKRNKKVAFPKWYIFLNELFDIFKNGKELFNFSLNNTNYNSVNGLTYIKGLIGISIILTIFGQTFVALINLPMKEYGIWDYYQIIGNPLYTIIFIGYRYSPRILFSCSGYSLIYKYLCYIEQEQGLYFLKFLFIQSYKYILLFIVLIFFRYSIYFINIILRQTKRPIWEIFKYYIDKEDTFFIRLFSFLFNIKEDGNEMKQALIGYFYIPINEIFFFLVGTILISFGYRFKLRIDIIILLLIVLIYASKIFFHLDYWYPKENYYTTIDYYLFDYGLTQLNPIYNLPNFLIGMYFGLINYTIQKGINDLYVNNSNYNNIIRLKSDYENQKTDIKTNFLKKSRSELKEIFNLRSNKLTINSDDEDDPNGDFNDSKSNRKKSMKEKNDINKKRIEDLNDINEKDNENLEKLISDEYSENNNKKKEYIEKIKQMPFLISPFKFSNFNRKYKDRWFFTLFIILTFLLIIFFIIVQPFFIGIKLDIEHTPENEEILPKLSFDKIIPDFFLNVIFLVDIEITVFLIQWGTFMLYFKQVEMIRTFLNHNNWSFFVKGYFTFAIVSIPVILFIFYVTETVIKLNMFNIILYGIINLILIFIVMILFYSFFELPLKKLFKYFLKGKDITYADEEDEEEEDDEMEGELLKDDESEKVELDY